MGDNLKMRSLPPLVVLCICTATMVLLVRAAEPKDRIPTKYVADLNEINNTLVTFRNWSQEDIVKMKNNRNILLAMKHLLLKPEHNGNHEAEALLLLCNKVIDELDALVILKEFQITTIDLWQKALKDMNSGAGQADVSKELTSILGGVGTMKTMIGVRQISQNFNKQHVSLDRENFANKEYRNGLDAVSIVLDHVGYCIDISEKLQAVIAQDTNLLNGLNSKLP